MRPTREEKTLDVAITKMILAVVAVKEENFMVSDVPVFYAKDQEEKELITTSLSRILEAVAHELGNGVYILVKH